MRQESTVDRPRAGQAARWIVLIVGGITLIAVLAIVAGLVISLHEQSLTPVSPERQRLRELFARLPDPPPEDRPLEDMASDVLLRTLRDAGESCDNVVTLFLQGSRARRGTFWNVECANGRTYAVRVKEGGATQVLTCEELRLIAGTNCFVQFSR